jgi:hypothetical protein
VREVVSGTVWRVSQKGAYEASSSQFGALLVRNMDEGLATEDAEAGHIGFIAAPRFFRSHVVESAGGRDVVQMSGMRKCVIPVGIGQVSVREHGSYFVEECAIHTFGDTVVLRGVGSCELPLDALVIQPLHESIPSVFPPTVAA